MNTLQMIAILISVTSEPEEFECEPVQSGLGIDQGVQNVEVMGPGNRLAHGHGALAPGIADRPALPQKLLALVGTYRRKMSSLLF